MLYSSSYSPLVNEDGMYRRGKIVMVLSNQCVPLDYVGNLPTNRSHGLLKNGGHRSITGLCDVENAGSFHRCDCSNEEETIEMPPVMKYFVAPYEMTPEVY